MVLLPDSKLSPCISTKVPPNDGPVEGDILENTGAEEICNSSERDSSDVERQTNETRSQPTPAEDIRHAARDGLLNVAG